MTKVARKLLAYARLGDSTGIATPVLLWFPTSRREANARAALARIHADLERPVATASADLLDQRAACPSAADAVWLPLVTKPAIRTSPRRELAELAVAWPHVPAPAAAEAADLVGSEATAYRLAPPPQPPIASPARVRRPGP